jgi:hypothetical protein
MLANEIALWLASRAIGGGYENGWRNVSAADALNLSNDGATLVFVFFEQPHGHVAVGMPSPLNDPGRQYVIAAGATCHARCLVSQTFGDRVPLIYLHEEQPHD